MSKKKNSSFSDHLDDSSLDLSGDSSASTSDEDSDNSRDFNLNSKKFTDCNLRENERKNQNSNIHNNNNNNNINNDNSNSNIENSVQEEEEFDSFNNQIITKRGKSDKKETQSGQNDLEVENSSGSENLSIIPETKKNSIPITSSSTPLPGTPDSQALCNLFSITSDGSSPETDNKEATFLVLKTALKQNKTFAIEEITKKFQDLSFAFKTDSMTIEKRVQLMKRRRDQAESNIENELNLIKANMKTLQCSGLNSENLNLMSDLKKQLDFLLNAIIQLSSSAEGYGYVQHEEKFLELVDVMIQHMENVESSKSSDSSKSASDKFKEERDEKGLNRRILSMVSTEKNSRRRASIADLPRVCILPENIGNKGLPMTPTRPFISAAKKLTFHQSSPKSQGSFNGMEDLRRDSICIRYRRERKNSESSMKNIAESPEQSETTVDSEIIEEPTNSLTDTEMSDSSLNLKQLFGSVEDIKLNNNSQEHISLAFCARRIFEWNKLLLSSTRFRWPDNVLHFVPFYITWYVVFVIAFVFIGGLFTGINVCHTYSCLKYSALWFAGAAFFTLTRRFYRILLLLLITILFAMILFFLWLTKVLLPRLTNEEVDSLFRTFGLEIQYLYGPPPV